MKTLIFIFLCIWTCGVCAARDTVSKDSAIVLAFDYLGSEMPTAKNQLKKIKCRDVRIKDDRSPYFRKFLNGKNAWKIAIPETVLTLPFNREHFDRPYSEFVVYLEKESGLLLKITYDFDKLDMPKEEFEDFEDLLIGRNYGYIGPMTVKPAPFLKIAGRAYEAKAFVGFALDVKTGDGTVKHYWHLVMYEAPYRGSYPPTPMTAEGEPERSQYRQGPPPKIREDNIFDGITGKSISGYGYSRHGI